MVLALLAAVTGAACSSPEAGKGEGEAFDLGRPSEEGKTDGDTPLLSSAELRRLERALEDAIEAAEAHIAELTRDIEKLESDNQAKAMEIQAIIDRINGRKREIEDQYNSNRNLCLVCLFLGCAPICFVTLAQQIDQDAEIRTLNERLAAAYQERKATLVEKVSALQTHKEHLLRLLQRGTAQPRAGLEAYPELAAQAGRVDMLTEVLDDSHQQIALLGEIRELAQALSDKLDAALANVTGLATAADALLQRMRDDTLEILRLLVAPSPAAAVEAWLEREVARRTRELLGTLDWPASLFVDFLIRTRGEGSEAELADLRERVLERLLDDTQVTTVHLVCHRGNLVDDGTRTFACDPAGVEGTIVGAKLDLVLRHSYIGDLHITVEHGEASQLLHDGQGGSQDDIEKVYVLDAMIGQSAQGGWGLTVRDDSADDTGRIVHWYLDLEIAPTAAP
jgi:hypothetical protein